jgi:predicted nucleotidyltransferase
MHVQISPEQIEEFCRKWKIREFALFGSVLRDDFRADSDVDVLVEFDQSAGHSLFGHVRMQDELADLFGRPVDLVEKGAVTNPFVREHILGNHQVIYHES